MSGKEYVDVSVVIPVRNRPEAIVRAIKSINAQTLLPREIIVVDDASTDNTPAVVEMVGGDVPIRLISLSENVGGGAARNAGIDAAGCQLLAFLDSDDEWLPDRLEKQLAYISGLDLEDYLCFSNLRVDRADGRPATPWNTDILSIGGGVVDYLLEKNQAIQTSTFLLPTRVARRIRFDDRLRRHQDIDFVIRAAQDNIEFVYVPEVLVHYSADVKSVRVSQRRNARPSLVWMNIARDYLTDAQLAAFYHKHVYDIELTDAPLRALVRGGRGVLSGHAPFVPWVKTSVRVLAPAGLKSCVRKLMALRGSRRSIGR